MSRPPRYSIKPPTEKMNLGIESPPLARTLPLHGVYIDRCIRPWFYESNHVLTGFNSRPITSSLSALYFSVEYYIYKLAIGTLAVVTMLINIHALETQTEEYVWWEDSSLRSHSFLFVENTQWGRISHSFHKELKPNYKTIQGYSRVLQPLTVLTGRCLADKFSNNSFSPVPLDRSTTFPYQFVLWLNWLSCAAVLSSHSFEPFLESSANHIVLFFVYNSLLGIFRWKMNLLADPLLMLFLITFSCGEYSFRICPNGFYSVNYVIWFPWWLIQMQCMKHLPISLNFSSLL